MSIQLMIEVESTARGMFLAFKAQRVTLFANASQITEQFFLDLRFPFNRFVTIT